MERKPIIIVQGGQWGSEGKGMVSSALGHIRKVDYAVRTGAVNAGHTVHYKGIAHKMQQLPTGWTRPETKLVIGAGAYIFPEILMAEIELIGNATGEGVNILKRIFIDHRAGLHLPMHTNRSTESGRHYSIGATGKGCSEAIMDKIRLRGKGGVLFKEWLAMRDNAHYPAWRKVADRLMDTADLLNGAHDAGQSILLEGTQGTFLDLHLGPYPFTTHKQCIAGQWPVECGLSPALEYEVVLCVRTYPIRVAGNSGPMPMETTWSALADSINSRLAQLGKPPFVNPIAVTDFDTAFRVVNMMEYPSEEAKKSEQARNAWNLLPDGTRAELSKLFEFTTVTKKLRRIAKLDMDMLRDSVMLNRPSSIVLTFANYMYPEIWNMKDGETDSQPDSLSSYMDMMANTLQAPVQWFTTGPADENFCWNRP